MPYVANDDEEQQQNPNVAQGPVSPTGGGSGSVRLSPSSSVPPVGGSSGGGGTPGATPTPAAGGQFASLQNYLGANQGQAAPLAGKITPGIDKQYNDLDTANNAAIANINSQVTNAPGYTASNPNVLSAEAANPVSFANDTGNVKQFQSLLNNSYGGPASAESTSDYANQQNTINQAIATGQSQTGTEAGRENLLSQNEAKPTAGVTALNSAILSQDPDALASIQNAYQPFNNLLTNLQTGAQGVDTTIGKEQADAATSSKAANDAISQQIGALNTGVTGELTTAQQNAAAQNAKLKSDLAAGTPSAADLQSLGMSQDQWNSLSAANKAAATAQTVNSANFQGTSGTTTIDPTQFLTQQDPNAVLNSANVATAGDYAKAQAFQTLLNGLNLQTPTAVINPATAQQAGTAPTNMNNYDYQTALNTATAAKADEVASAQAYVNAIQSGADEEHAQLAAKDAAQKAAIRGGILALPGGVALSGMAGTGQGIYNSIAGDIKNPSLSHTADILNSIAGPKSIVNAGKGIVAGISGAVSTISNIFCFHPYTLVEMADGDVKMICNITIGDETKGGKVLGVTRGIGQEFYWYGTTLVTGKHAVREDGMWVRVENSRRGEKVEGITEVVCNLITDKHRIWVNGVEFADERETDGYESLDLDESLAALNKI